MDCLVTGGAGFIGSNLVDALVARGDRVTVIDSFVTGRRSNLEPALAQGITLHEIDVRDHQAVSEVFAATRPKLVFHLAAQIDVRYSVEHPAGDADINVLGTIAVLEARVRRRRAGSCSLDRRRPVRRRRAAARRPRTHPIRPLAPYGQGKYAAEGYCELYARLHGLSTVSLRYGNVYGPRQDVHGEAGVVAIFCGRLIDGRRPTVFGDGRQTRDWVEVGDVVRANLLAADAELTGPVNIGWGRETAVLDLLEALRDVDERGAALSDPEFVPERTGEVRRSCLDVARAGASWGGRRGAATRRAAQDPG